MVTPDENGNRCHSGSLRGLRVSPWPTHSSERRGEGLFLSLLNLRVAFIALATALKHREVMFVPEDDPTRHTARSTGSAGGTGEERTAVVLGVKGKLVPRAFAVNADHLATLVNAMPEWQPSVSLTFLDGDGEQLAACNLTLGAPTVDYRRMNLGTMPHGPQADDDVRAGSLELLTAADNPNSLHGLLNPERSMEELKAEHIDADERIEFQPKDLGLVIMNPPFTDNQKRARKFGTATTKQMQAREAAIQAETSRRDPRAGSVITANSISTFFTPLAEQVLNRETGVLARCCLSQPALPQEV